MVLPKILQYVLVLDPTRVDIVLSNSRLFFVVGMGRSGTTFLADLLDNSPGCAVYHEIDSDRRALVNAYHDSSQAAQYLSGERKRLIAGRVLYRDCHTYGEVNSYLRYHVDALRDLWKPTILHLVRDGRDVVQSLMNRKTYSSADKDHSGQIRPAPQDPFYNRWSTMDRFARICWYWAHTNQFLLGYQLPIVRLEDITNSYEQFDRQVLQPLDINLSPNTWKEAISNPKNVSRRSIFPGYSDWSQEHKQQFWSICGGTLSELGYDQ